MKAYQITVKIYFYNIPDPYGWAISDEKRRLLFWKEEKFVLSAEELAQENFFLSRNEKALDNVEGTALVFDDHDLKLYLLRDEQGVYLHYYRWHDGHSDGICDEFILVGETKKAHTYTYAGSTMGERYGEEENVYEIIFEEIDV